MPAVSEALWWGLIELGTWADLHMFGTVTGVSEYHVAGLEGIGSQWTCNTL